MVRKKIRVDFKEIIVILGISVGDFILSNYRYKDRIISGPYVARVCCFIVIKIGINFSSKICLIRNTAFTGGSCEKV